MKNDNPTASALLRVLGEKSNLIILMHDNPDPDAIASAMGLQAIVARRLGKPAGLFSGGIIGRAENRAFVSLLDISLSQVDEVNWPTVDGVLLVDTQPGAGNNSLPRRVVPVGVIDHHHPRQRGIDRVPFVDLRPHYGACSTIVTEYLRELDIPADQRLATALFYGIKVDTMDLGRHASPADVEAYMHLFPLADKALLPKIEYPPLPQEYFETFHSAFERAAVYGNVVVASLDEIDNPNVTAEVAELLLRLEGTRWSICTGFFDGQLFVSTRTADVEANSHELVRRAIGTVGSGGGHGMSAGGRVAVPGRTWQERARSRDQVVLRLLRLLGVANRTPQPLLRPRQRGAAAS